MCPSNSDAEQRGLLHPHARCWAKPATTSAALRGSRWRRRCGPSSAATTICGLTRRSSSRHEELTRRSCFAWMYRTGTATRPSSARTSHPSTARRRAASTFDCAEETADRTAANNEGDASGPTSQSLAARFGRGIRNRSGASNLPSNCRQPRTGLVANPAQRTIPTRFTGFDAAYWIASGVEKDSARSMNGPEVGMQENRYW